MYKTVAFFTLPYQPFRVVGKFESILLLLLFLKFFDCYTCFGEELHGKIIWVRELVHYALYAAVDDKSCADSTGLMSTVERGAFK